MPSASCPETVGIATANRADPRWKVALVGRRLRDNENLGLAYLAAALDEAGFGYERFQVNRAADVEAVAEAILRDGFQLVGLSIPDGGSAYLPLAFGELLHRRGFRKPITCGGSFATLARHWLLERYPWLDSVVRFAGEIPLVALARALRDGADLAGVPGLTTRAGDGLPAPVLDDKPLRLRPARDELPEILGHRAAHILATRGCAGRCGYCAPAALQSQERKEGLRKGAPIEVLHQAGVGRVRRRSVADVCDEMAALWCERGVRYFYFVDEHLLPYQEEEALAFLADMRDELRRRKVGRLGIGTMLRADRLTGRIVRAFAEVGLVRAFVGIEFASAQDGEHFGRSTDAARARDVLAACAGAGVVAVSNMMMLHPYSSQESIADAIRFMEAAPAGVFEVTDMRVYHGTRLWRRMGEEGRLFGNPLRYSYSFLDPAVQRFSEIFTRLRAESFWNHSIAFRTQDAFLAYALARRLRPQADLGLRPPELDAIRDQVVSLYCETYWRALAMAQAGLGGAEATDLIAEARARSLQLQGRLDDLVRGLAFRLQTSPEVFSPSRAAAAAAIAFTVLGGTTAGCNSSLRVPNANDAAVASDARQEAPAGQADRPVIAPDAGIDWRCPESMESEQIGQHQAAALQAAPCFTGRLTHYEGKTPVLYSTFPWGPGANISELCWGSSGESDPNAAYKQKQAEWQAQVVAAVAGLDSSCIGRPHRYQDMAIDGGVGTQAREIWQAMFDCDPARDPYAWSPNSYSIVVDSDGKVVATTGLPDELSACMLAALKDLRFPCLAGASLCESFLLE